MELEKEEVGEMVRIVTTLMSESPSPQTKEWCWMRGRASGVTFAIPFTRAQQLACLSALPIVTAVNKCKALHRLRRLYYRYLKP